nr:uncharacterized protein LOC128699335 [Cherax quadricarinatus]
MACQAIHWKRPLIRRSETRMSSGLKALLICRHRYESSELSSPGLKTVWTRKKLVETESETWEVVREEPEQQNSTATPSISSLTPKSLTCRKSPDPDRGALLIKVQEVDSQSHSRRRGLPPLNLN